MTYSSTGFVTTFSRILERNGSGQFACDLHTNEEAGRLVDVHYVCECILMAYFLYTLTLP